jgi:hypothetical protein
VKSSSVINVWNSRNNLTFFDIVQLIVSTSSICKDVKIDVIDSSEYNIKCIDMFGNVSLELFITVHNPAIKGFLVKLFTQIQHHTREREKTQ